MQIERLRLAGFKSFVETTELAIEPGLTGIVGPNGCGKSNLVEALRWVMGEGSARRLRGGDMDELIFAGTAARPPRNIAEVALTINNNSRDAPFAFSDCEEIEIVRRVERGSGSTYRVNGREVRARDVQLLFADSASGAQSGAMVSQGRINALIDAKPAERRLLLDEAAGTAGLHARRRETELKLDAAEENLSRLDDVVSNIGTQFAALQKQARQAQRYRRLAEQARQTEALLFHARWLGAQAEAEDSAKELGSAERAVAEATERAVAEAQAREAAETVLPRLRQADAAAAAELQRLTHARSNLEQELQRVVAAHGDGERRLAQLAADLEREEAHSAEARQGLARFSEERDQLARAEAEHRPLQESASVGLREAAARLIAAEATLQAETEAAARIEARRSAIERRRKELAERRARLELRRADGERQRANAAATLVTPEEIAAAAASREAAEQQVSRWRASVEAGEAEIQARRADEQAALDAARAADARLTRLAAEAQALRTLVAAAPSAAGGPPILSSLRVPAGFEAAIGAAFDDELLVPLADSRSSAAARFWVELPGAQHSPPLPPGAHPLAATVTGPPALSRSLAQAGWVDSAEKGSSLQPDLAPGQRLVDRDGRLWRWDGFTTAAARPSPAAEHLRQRNRLAELDRQIAAAEAESSAVEHRAAEASAQRQRATEAEKAARLRLREVEAALAQAGAAEADLARRAVTTETRLAGVSDILDKLSADLTETEAQAAEAEGELAELRDPGCARATLDRARNAAGEARRREAEARATMGRLDKEAALRRDRQASIAVDQHSWRKRGDDAAAQRRALLERRAALEAEIAALTARPAAIAAEGEALGGEISAVAADCRRSADALAAAEERLRQCGDGSRLADHSLAQARERLARLEVRHDSAAASLVQLVREIGERLGTTPETLGELAGVTGREPPTDPAAAAVRLERLIRERDGMGPVNLMAEDEAAKFEAQITALQSERTDLTEAIARLRRGIAALDGEMRRRLAAAFERINQHFSALFTGLFGGGRAQLTLEGDDPLAAGLEIMASPPGKRLQALTLLSGGEQALTALALLFAAFLTNPVPVCVLDEVDAPLDDANVDRFCKLVQEIADAAGTRFLLITHHRITMARVDRLFGVTMAERGVSQLVSVDLVRPSHLRQTA